MAELPGLGDLLLGGYDVSALLAGAPSQATGSALLSIEAQLQLKAAALPQQALGWPTAAPSDQNDIYQKVAQSLAAKLEEHRLQQVQVATALQQLQALQQQQELAQLQQQLSALHQHVPRAAAANPFQRSRTTDLESLGRGPGYDLTAGTYAQMLDFEQQQKQLVALQHATRPATTLVGLQRIPGVVGQHNLPVRSFSSEHLVAGQRRPPQQLLANGATGQLGLQVLANSKRPPNRQPSGLGPNGRNGGGNGGAGGGAGGPNGRNGGGDGGRRARYAASAKAPSWASEDWHPMKAVIASGAHASGGTGVFLPHLSSSSANNNNNNNSGNGGSSSAVSSGSSVSAAGVGATMCFGSTSGGSASGSNASTLNGYGVHNHSHGHNKGLGSAAAPPPPLSARSSVDHTPPPPLPLTAAGPLSSHPRAAVVSSLSPPRTAQAPQAYALANASLGQGGSSGHSPAHSPVSPSHQAFHAAQQQQQQALHLDSSGSPVCSVESNAVGAVPGGDPYSRHSTLEFSRGSSHSDLDTSHQPTSFGYFMDPMKVVVEEPEREEREDGGNGEEECDFVSLARELAELMSKQAIAE